jgi:hypothetical protein
VSEVSKANPARKVTVAARVPPELAQALAVLADAGNRTVSREVSSAIREHVARSAQVSAVQGDGPFLPADLPAAHDRDPESAGSRSRPLRAGQEAEG